MAWQAMAEVELLDRIAEAETSMTDREKLLWQAIRVRPCKWKQSPQGDFGGGFWVVGILGELVVWFNDIEDGFNWSGYVCHGEIGSYRCNQDELAIVIRNLLTFLDTGVHPGPNLGAPQPVGL
jgi:hypothetical protein